MNKLDDTPQTLTLRQSLPGLPMKIEITPGEHWSERMQAGPFIFNILPQFVIWAEDRNGRLIDTLYITGAGGREFRHAAKKKKGSAFYAECLPLWASRMQAAGNPLPGEENPYPDSVTSATPMADFTLRTKSPVPENGFTLFFEINKSDDVTDEFTRENNDWAGQPSLIYSLYAGEREKGRASSLNLIGHGGCWGTNPGSIPIYPASIRPFGRSRTSR